MGAFIFFYYFFFCTSFPMDGKGVKGIREDGYIASHSRGPRV